MKEMKKEDRRRNAAVLNGMRGCLVAIRTRPPLCSRSGRHRYPTVVQLLLYFEDLQQMWVLWMEDVKQLWERKREWEKEKGGLCGVWCAVCGVRLLLLRVKWEKDMVRVNKLQRGNNGLGRWTKPSFFFFFFFLLFGH